MILRAGSSTASIATSRKRPRGLVTELGCLGAAYIDAAMQGHPPSGDGSPRAFTGCALWGEAMADLCLLVMVNAEKIIWNEKKSVCMGGNDDEYSMVIPTLGMAA